MKRPLTAAAVVGLVAIVPMFLFGFITCISPIVILILVGWLAAHLSISKGKPETISKGTELGALAALTGGGVASIGYYLYLVALSLSEITNDADSIIATGLAILMMSMFLLPFAVATGAITGYNRTRRLLTPS